MSFSPPAGTPFSIYKYESVDISVSYVGTSTYTYTLSDKTTSGAASLVSSLSPYVRLSNPFYNGTAPSTERLAVVATGADSNVFNASYPISVAKGRFLPFSYNPNLTNGSNLTLYVNESFPALRFQTQALQINPPIADINGVLASLPVGLQFVKVSPTAYDLVGVPATQTVSRTYRVLSTGSYSSSDVVTNFITIVVNPERVILTPPGPTLSFPGLAVGSNLPVTPITASYPGSAIGNLLYTWTTLPPGFLFKDPNGNVITRNYMYSMDANSTLTLSGTATVDTLNFFVANGNPFTTTLKAVRQTQPLISNVLGLQFSFQDSVILTPPTVLTQYVGVPFKPSSQPFFTAYSTFGSTSAISNIFSPNLVADLSVIFHPGRGTADLSGTPQLVDVPGGIYTFRAINSNGLSTDISTSVPIALDSVNLTSTMDASSTFILSRDSSNALTGYYRAPLQFTAFAGSGNAVTFSAPALSGTGLSLSNVSSNTVQIVGTPVRTSGLNTLSVTATAANTQATATLTKLFSVANDTITITPFTLAPIQNVAIAPLQVTASSLSGRSVVSYSGLNFPNGLSISSTGLISGIPRVSGNVNMTVNGSTGYASGTLPVSYSITPDNILLFSEYPSYTLIPGGPVSANISGLSYSGGVVSNFRFSNLSNTIGKGVVAFYSSSNSYAVSDLVTFQGDLYTNISDSSNIPPSNKSYWLPTIYSSTTSYPQNFITLYSSQYWIAAQANSNQLPGTPIFPPNLPIWLAIDPNSVYFQNAANTYIDPSFGMVMDASTGHIGGTLINGVPPALLPSSCNFSVYASSGYLDGSLSATLSTINRYVSNQYIVKHSISNQASNGLFFREVSGVTPTPLAPVFAAIPSGTNYPTDFQLRPNDNSIGGRFLLSYINNLNPTSNNANIAPYIAYSDNGFEFNRTPYQAFVTGNAFGYYDADTNTQETAIVALAAINALLATDVSSWVTVGYVGGRSPSSGSRFTSPALFQSATDGVTWTTTVFANGDDTSANLIYSRSANGSNFSAANLPSNFYNSYLMGGFATGYDTYRRRVLVGGASVGLGGVGTGGGASNTAVRNYGYYDLSENTWVVNGVSSPFAGEIAYINTDVSSLFVATGTSAWCNVTSPPTYPGIGPYTSNVVLGANTVAYSTNGGVSWTQGHWTPTDTSFNVIGGEIASDGVGRWLACGVYATVIPPSSVKQFMPMLAYSLNGRTWTPFTLPSMPNLVSSLRWIPPLPIGPIYYSPGTATWHVFVSYVSGYGQVTVNEYTHDNNSSFISGWTALPPTGYDPATTSYVSSDSRLLAARPAIYTKPGGDLLANLSFSVSKAGGPTLINPSYTNLTLVQYIPMTPIVLLASGTGKIYYYVTQGDLPLGIYFDVQTSTFSGTPAQTGSSDIRIFIRDDNGTTQYNFTITVIFPTVTTRPMSGAGAFTSYIRQYTLADAAQNSRNNKILSESALLGEFMAPYGGDTISATIDPKCKNPLC